MLRSEFFVSYCETMEPLILTFSFTRQITVCHSHFSAHRANWWARAYRSHYSLTINDIEAILDDCPDRYPGELVKHNSIRRNGEKASLSVST